MNPERVAATGGHLDSERCSVRGEFSAPRWAQLGRYLKMQPRQIDHWTRRQAAPWQVPAMPWRTQQGAELRTELPSPSARFGFGCRVVHGSVGVSRLRTCTTPRPPPWRDGIALLLLTTPRPWSADGSPRCLEDDRGRSRRCGMVMNPSPKSRCATPRATLPTGCAASTSTGSAPQAATTPVPAGCEQNWRWFANWMRSTHATTKACGLLVPGGPSRSRG